MSRNGYAVIRFATGVEADPELDGVWFQVSPSAVAIDLGPRGRYTKATGTDRFETRDDMPGELARVFEVYG